MVLFYVKLCNTLAGHGAIVILVSVRLVLGTIGVGLITFDGCNVVPSVANRVFTLFAVAITTTRTTINLTVLVTLCHGGGDIGVSRVSTVGRWVCYGGTTTLTRGERLGEQPWITPTLGSLFVESRSNAPYSEIYSGGKVIVVVRGT